MAGGKFGTMLVHKPFSLTELKQLRADFSSYTTNPDNYIDQFQHISLDYDLTWKDVMIIRGQTLSDPEQERVIKEARKFASTLHLSDTKFPIGETAFLSTDPNWDYNDKDDMWGRNHFLFCIKTGLKNARQKVINYSKVAAISQGPEENPVTFLERLRDTLTKYTNLDLDTYEGQVILRDKFLSQSSSDIRKKLQKQVQANPNNSTDELLTTASTVLYGRDQEEEAGAQGEERGRRPDRLSH